MTHHVGPPLAALHYYGYSCQVWFVREIVGELFGTGSRRVWFSLQFNPIDNVASSNPCWLYTELSRAVQQNDVGSKLIRGYRVILLDLVKQQQEAGKVTGQQATDYTQRITAAPVPSFRPEVWRLDLRNISARKYGHVAVAQLKAELRHRAQQAVQSPQVLQPDEYLIDDLQENEFDIIIRG
jgi:hypothetical protein